MTISELFDLLCDKSFQDPETGNLFFPAYMYIYKPDKEYQIRAQIKELKERLIRPNNYVDVLILNLFDVFLEFLQTRDLGGTSLYDILLKSEHNDPEKVTTTLKREASSEPFFSKVNTKIQEHLRNVNQYKKSYIFIHGFGEIFPYLRASKFLSKFEKFISGYKIILFYPGTAKDYYSLFDLLNDENPYRAIKLLNPGDQQK